MADHERNNSAADRPTWPAPSAIRLGGLTAGAMGLLGFGLAIFCGMSAGNTSSQIIVRSLLTSIVLAVIGGLVGLVASHLLAEHLQRQIAEARKLQAETAPQRQPEYSESDGDQAAPEQDENL